MNRKDILELKRRFKKDECTFTKICGCYVDGEKNILLTFRETFLNLPDEEFYKYLEISKKILSGTIGNNLLELNFTPDENLESKQQEFLMRLKRSGLKDEQLLEELYSSIIASYEHVGNYLILLYHDAYDVMTKTSDNLKLDESEEVYEYIMCAICPVSLSKPGLGYFEQEVKIKARIRDWVVEAPATGFTFPGFIDRSTDVNTVMYYTKNAKLPKAEFMETALGCAPKQTATIQKETFQNIIESTVSPDEDISKKAFSKIQDNLHTMIEEYDEIYEDTQKEPISLSKGQMKNLLLDSGVSEDATSKIEIAFEENFGDDIPLAKNLLDKKLVKENEQKKKEEKLIKQVEVLETQLEEVKKNKVVNEDAQEQPLEIAPSSDEETNLSNYDVVLQVHPDKLPKITTEMIHGQKCILVPIDEDEQATVNGRDDIV